MSRATIARHYDRILKAWPKDPLRPDVSFQKILQKRIDAQKTEPTADSSATSGISKQTAFSDGAELRQVNALYSLLDNRYAKQYPVSKAMMSPTFNPTYYHQLAAEFAEIPNLTFWQRIVRRIKSRIKFS